MSNLRCGHHRRGVVSRTKMFVATNTGILLMGLTFEGAWGFAPRIVDVLGENWNLKRPDILDVLMPFEANVLEMTLPGRYLQGKQDIQQYCLSLLRFSETYPVASGNTCMFKDIVEMLCRSYFEDNEFVAFQLSDNTWNPWKVKIAPPDGEAESPNMTWVREYNLVTDKCALIDSDVIPQRAHMRHVPERVSSLYEVGMDAVDRLRTVSTDASENERIQAKAFKEAVKESTPDKDAESEELEAWMRTHEATKKRTKHIKPLIRKNGKLWETKKKSLVPSMTTTQVPEGSLKAIAEFKAIIPYGYYGFFQPQLDEVVRCIPDHLLSQVDFFEVNGPNTVHDMNRERIAFNAGYQVAYTTLYAKVKS